MKETKTKEIAKTVSTTELMPHSSDSKSLLVNSKQEESQGTSLSLNIAEHLLSLMKDVTKNDVNPQTVDSACKCANSLYNIMKLNLEIKKFECMGGVKRE